MFKLVLEKAEEPEIKLLTSAVPGASMGDPTHDKVMWQIKTQEVP